ncbi:class IV adenylate cyclase [Vibrio fluvialis]|nr:class IV adenylate cyclase [Vibrio fluvialis]
MSQSHFSGRYEVELKYRIASKAQFLKQLSQIPHDIMLEDNYERDDYFDTPQRTLREQSKALCIRDMQPSGNRLWIVKGPGDDRCQATNITDVEAAKSMLVTLGYECVLTMQKTRSIYFVGDFHITVDVLPGIGEFAEFAIMTDDDSALEQYRAQILELAAKFGLTEQQREHRSYRTLFEIHHNTKAS